MTQSVGYETTNIPLVAEGGAAVASIFEIERERTLERTEDALRIFDVEARHADIPYTTRAASAIPAEAWDMICAAA